MRADTMIDYYLDVYNNSLSKRHQEYAIAMIAYHSGVAKYPHRDIVECVN